MGRRRSSSWRRWFPLLDSHEIRYVWYLPRNPRAQRVCSNASKVRIIALYIQFRDGVPDEDRRACSSTRGSPARTRTRSTVCFHLGVRVTRVCLCSCPLAPIHLLCSCRGDKDIRKRLKQKAGAGRGVRTVAVPACPYG